MSFVRRWWRWMRCWLWAGWFPLHNDRDDAWQPCGLPQSVEPCVGNIAVPPDHNTTLQKSIHKSLHMGLHKILDMSCTPCMSHHVICHVHHASASCNCKSAYFICTKHAFVSNARWTTLCCKAPPGGNCGMPSGGADGMASQRA